MSASARPLLPFPLKLLFVVCFFGSILFTAGAGLYTFEQAPPYPERTVDQSGRVLFDRETLLQGQAAFQRHGLMDVGSVWGHGTYRGTEFTATTLHLIGVRMREFYARQLFGKSFAGLTDDQRAALDQRVVKEIKENRYREAAATLTLTPAQISAWEWLRNHWDGVFSKGDRESAISPGVISQRGERLALADFFYWTAWAAGTRRPGKALTYTNNWPPDRSVGNELSSKALIWTGTGLVALFALLGMAIVAFFYFRFDRDDGEKADPAQADQILKAPLTPSQRKAAKFFLVAVGLFFLQTLMGGLMAHYTVHPGSFYGINWVSQNIPYNWPKSWHLQLAVLWIATSWLGAAIYLGPLLSGREPKKQGFLVDLLFVALVVVALASLTGEVLGIKELAGKHWFWLGHQGWEYLELGRLWQILLFGGLLFWLVLVARTVKGQFGKGEGRWDLVPFYVYSAIAIVAFFAFGFFFSPRTHIVVADFWRWWVVHTWVEGIFEFFAAAAIALVLVSLGLATRRAALGAAYLTASLALATGIIGVGHHYYWFGDPDIWLAVGGVLSAMEPVPIVLVLLRSVMEMRSSPAARPGFPYRWPLAFLGASAGWSFVGAGVFGFSITTPLVSYYEHSTYLTMNHGHTALLGTYGCLAIGLMLLALRGMVRPERWKEPLVKLSFVGINGGLALMALGTLVPVGLMQLNDSYVNGLWHARSPLFYNLPWVRLIGQWRVVPDSIIIVLGVIPLGLFILYSLFNLRPIEVKES